jgi:glutamine synthetase
MNTQEILQFVKSHPSGKVKIAITDMDGILRGKYISTEKFFSIVESGTGFCDVIFGWDAADAAYDNASYTGWHTGYPDAAARLDLATFRKIPWENDCPFFLCELIPQKENPEICPRSLLRKVLSDASSAGFLPLFSQEFEWYNFAETPQSLHDKQYRNLVPLTPGMFGYSILRGSFRNDFMTDLFKLLTAFGIPVEGLHTETGPGVYEAAIAHSEILEAGDRAVLFKTAVKEIAYKHGIIASFMAKVSESLPGCGGHIHQSLWDADKNKNLFFDEKETHKMSTVMKQFLAGQLLLIPQILPLFAPTINSYKRLVQGAWAPTTLTWGMDNRTVAFRVLSGGKTSCRLETRIVGADVNPYLAMAGLLAAGLYGIKNKIPLKQPPTMGNGYMDKSHGELSTTLDEATRSMKQSAIAREILGDGFVNHFTSTREWEWRQYLKPVTDWEMRRYFEII